VRPRSAAGDDEREVRAYRTGSPLGYLAAALLLVLAVALTFGHLRVDYLRDENRLAMAGLAALTFGAMGVYALLSASMPAVIVSDTQVCLREWFGGRQWVPLASVRGLTWSFRYARPGLLQDTISRAWMEIDYTRKGGGAPRHLLVEYAGRGRHDSMVALVRDLASHCDIEQTAGPPLDELLAVGGELVFGPAAGRRQG